MPILTDEEAKALATLCPPHKIILDGGGLIATIQSARTVAYRGGDWLERAGVGWGP